MKKLNPMVLPTPQGLRSKKKKRGGGGIFRFLATVVFIAAGVFAYAWMRSDDPVGYLRKTFGLTEQNAPTSTDPQDLADPLLGGTTPSSQQNNLAILNTGPRAPSPSTPARPTASSTTPTSTQTPARSTTSVATTTTTTTPAATASTPARTTPATLTATQKLAARLREIDSLTKEKDYSAAKEKLKSFIAECKLPDYASQAIYRAGLIGRLEKNENDARRHWADAYKKYPKTVGGRLAALALADSYFVEATQNPPQYDKWEAVRNIYSDALGMDDARFLPAAVKKRVVTNLTYLNKRLVFSPAPIAGAVYHTVAPGEYLSSIAQKYKVHYESIATINHINPRTLRQGTKLKILNGECTIVVSKTDLTCTWYLDGKWVKQYPCCVGPQNKTPPGEYRIISKDTNPDWRNPADGKIYRFGDPENIIGTRWMGLEGGTTVGLGIHGTALEESIPGRTSNGCVRLHNKDVEELYGFALLRSRVIILP